MDTSGLVSMLKPETRRRWIKEAILNNRSPNMIKFPWILMNKMELALHEKRDRTYAELQFFLFGVRSLVVWHCLLFHVVHVSGICFIRSQGARFISCYLHRRECLYYVLLLRCMHYFSSGNLCPSGLGSACLCHHSK